MQSLKKILFSKSVFTKLSHLRENLTALPTVLSGKSTEYFRILFCSFLAFPLFGITSTPSPSPHLLLILQGVTQILLSVKFL